MQQSKPFLKVEFTFGFNGQSQLLLITLRRKAGTRQQVVLEVFVFRLSPQKALTSCTCNPSIPALYFLHGIRVRHGRCIMKIRTLIAAVFLLVLSGCVAYTYDPYPYNYSYPYSYYGYGPYYYPYSYRPYYYGPSLYFDYSYRHHRNHYPRGGWHHHRRH